MNKSGETLLIGVDGGGTGCRVAVGTAKSGVLAIQSGGRANASTDLPLTIANITATVKAATIKSGRDPAGLTQAVAHLGLAGVKTPTIADKVARALPYGHSEVTEDRDIAVTGALDGADGYLVSIGTGSIIAASHAHEFSFIGGWGLQLSDQASGAWLGRAALKRTLLCHDRIQDHTDLTRGLLAHFKGDPNEIVSFSLTAMPGDYGAFAPQVVDAARRGDAQGLDLMRAGADYITRGLAVLGFQKGDALCLTGGVGQHYAGFLGPDLTGRIVQPKRSAVEGAFQLALQAARKLDGDGR